MGAVWHSVLEFYGFGFYIGIPIMDKTSGWLSNRGKEPHTGGISQECPFAQEAERVGREAGRALYCMEGQG